MVGDMTEPTEKQDQDAQDAGEGPDDDLFICTCRWALMDSGTIFNTRIAWSDPYCRVHRKQ